jgi:Family of unknown function (DUF6010)
MIIIPRPPITLANIVAPICVSGLFIAAMSMLREPNRKKVSALLIAGAGTAYYGGGFGWWEVAFCALFLWLAFRGLENYRYVGIAWTLHIVWDILHHLYGHSILPFLPLSSLGCAICDAGIAGWYFMGAPSLIRPPKQLRNT